MILNIHGEKAHLSKEEEARGNVEDEINVINAEPKFLPALRKLHADFPKLKIVLEHCTTHESIALIRELNKGKTENDEVFVSATITAHHLYLIIDQWAGNPINFCKPVAKFQKDRQALIDAATSGEPWFFWLGLCTPPNPQKASTRWCLCWCLYTIQRRGLCG